MEHFAASYHPITSSNCLAFAAWKGGASPYHYYTQDHLGNNRVVVNDNGTIEQTTHYYSFGAPYADAGMNSDFQKYKYTGKELDLTHGLNTYDHGARQNYSLLGVWDRLDPMVEKYYNISPYAACENNPVTYIDLWGDSLKVDIEALKAIYNGLEKGSKVSFRVVSGVLDPNSFKKEATNRDDTFLKDLYEISSSSIWVDLKVTDKNIYFMDGEEHSEKWNEVIDYNVSDESEPMRTQLIENGYLEGKHIRGNGGQTLYPFSSKELKRSLNENICININCFQSLNQMSSAIAHEFAHVVLYLRGEKHSHPERDDFIYNRQWNVMKRLGYNCICY